MLELDFFGNKYIFQLKGFEYFDELPSDYKNYAGVFESALKNYCKIYYSKIFCDF